MNNNEVEKLLESKEIKPTSNRILIIRELMKSTNPVNLADLEILLGFTLDKASIFRVLELFTKKDVVHVIEDGSRSLKYELCHSETYHTIADQHIHFHCEQCKETYCLTCIKVPVVELPEGFHSHAINYVIKGLCPKCNKH